MGDETWRRQYGMTRRRLLGSLALAALGLPLADPLRAASARDLAGKRLYIVHGYAASPRDHWFPWLSERLTRRGAEVVVLALPGAAEPRPQAWRQHLLSQVQRHDAQTFFAAHSLGCIALLQHLSGLDDGARIGGLLLVSGFSVPLPGLPQLDGFAEAGYVPSRVMALTSQRTVLASRNDRVVPYDLSKALSQELQTRLVTVERGGHVLASDGFTRGPEAEAQLAAMFASPATPEARDRAGA